MAGFAMPRGAMLWVAALLVLVASSGGRLVTAARAGEAEVDPTERISELRSLGRYAEAREACAEFASTLDRQPDAPMWLRHDARRTLETLDRILAMPDADRARMRVADSLGIAIDAAWAADELEATARAAADRLAIQEPRLGTDHPEVWETRNALALALEDLGVGERSLPLMEQVMEAAVRQYEPDHPAIDASANNLATMYDARGRFEEAERLYRTALRIARRNAAQDPLGLAVALNNLGDNLWQQGDFRGAIAAQQEALVIRRAAAGPRSSEYAQTAQNLAASLTEAGRPREAVALLREAIRVYRAHPEQHRNDLAAAWQSLGHARYALREFAGSDSAFAAALVVRERTRGVHHPQTERLRVNRAITLRELGRVEEAIGLMRPAVDALARVFGDDHVDVVWARRNLAETLLLAGHEGDAESLLVQAAEALERMRLRIPAGDRRSRFAVSPEPLLAALRIRRGQAQPAWEGLERSLARGLGDQLAFARSPEITSDERLTESALRRRLLLADQRLEAASDAGQVVPDSLRSQREVRLAEWVSFVGTLTARHPSAFSARPVTLDSLQAVLAEDEALLGWLEAEYAGGRTLHFAYVIRHTGGVSWVPLPADSVRGTGPGVVARLQDALRDGRSSSLLVPQVARLRLDPVRPLLQGVRRIKVVPSGDMLGVPLEVLLDPAGHQAGPVATSYAPSATLLHRGRALPPRLAGDAAFAALVFCDPPFKTARAHRPVAGRAPAASGAARAASNAFTARRRGIETARRAVDSWSRASLAELPPLPRTREEGRTIARLVGPSTRVIEGARCTEQAVVELARADSLRAFRLLHFATHALIDEHDPDRSALVLSQLARTGPEGDSAGSRPYDGLVTAREIRAEWRLDADLVTLSACATGLGERVAGEGYIGFAQALMSVGARNLLISLWSVDDRSTALLMSRFYENLMRSGGGPSRAVAALAEAKQWFRAGAGGELRTPRDDPYYWAGFVLLGD